MSHGTQNARRQAVDASINGPAPGWHAYTPATVVWAKRAGGLVSVRNQAGEHLALFTEADFDQHFRPTADQTDSKKENA